MDCSAVTTLTSGTRPTIRGARVDSKAFLDAMSAPLCVSAPTLVRGAAKIVRMRKLFTSIINTVAVSLALAL